MTPTPSPSLPQSQAAQEWLKESERLIDEYAAGLGATFLTDWSRYVDKCRAALLAHLAARPQEQPKPNTEAAHLMAPVGTDLPPALSEDTRDALHAAIMNLPAKVPDALVADVTREHFLLPQDPVIRAYRIGHRDARHASAELVAERLAAFPAGLKPELQKSEQPHLTSRPTKDLLSARSATLEDLGDDGPVGHGWQISVSLDGHAGPGVYAHMSEYPEEGSIFLAAIPSALPEPPIYWRHRKTRGVYRLVGQAQLQTDAPLADMAHVMVYQGADGKLWARAASEYAGRFDRVAAREARVEPSERSNSEPAKPDEKAPVLAVAGEALQVLRELLECQDRIHRFPYPDTVEGEREMFNALDAAEKRARSLVGALQGVKE